MLKILLDSLDYLKQILDKPIFAYTTIILLQLKLIWRIWDYKDLTSGDTASYFSSAYLWFTDVANNIIWSPLYTSFFGSFLHITSDVYIATILHRIVIIFATSSLILMLMRRLLPSGIAWFITAWWVILPINFDTLYEVHLFSVIPVLLACLIIIQKPIPLARGGAIAVLLCASMLVRNEFFLIAVAVIIICIIWEVLEYRRMNEHYNVRQYTLGYGIPLLFAGLLILVFYNQSIIKFPELSTKSIPKHTLNICQVYAFGYQQRYPGKWLGDPWTGCQDLMMQKFGQSEPSLFQTLTVNPLAMLEHFRWNFSLTLNGLQVSLFNATSGSVNPDYPPVILKAYWVIFPTLFIGILSVTGIFFVFHYRQFWWNFWIKDRILAWLVLTSTASVAFFVVIPMQRPRPSYLFGLTIFLMAIVGMSFFVLTHNRPKCQYLSRILPVFIAWLITFSQPYYINNHGNRPLLTLYRRFQPFQSEIANQETIFLSREYSFEICSYLMNPKSCQSLSYASPGFWDSLLPQQSINTFLDSQGVNFFYVDHSLLKNFSNDARFSSFFKNPTDFDWKILGQEDSTNDKWMLLQKLVTVSQVDSFPDDLIDSKITYQGISLDGWLQKKSFIELFQPEGAKKLKISGLIPKVEHQEFQTSLTILIDEKPFFQKPLEIGEFNIELEVPAELANRRISLHFSNHQQLPPPDQRQVSARLYFIGFIN